MPNQTIEIDELLQTIRHGIAAARITNPFIPGTLSTTLAIMSTFVLMVVEKTGQNLREIALDAGFNGKEADFLVEIEPTLSVPPEMLN